MLGLALLLGMAPPGDLAPPAARSGEPAPHLSWRTGLQWRLSERAPWQRFRATWGDGWAVRWDERSGSPRFLWAPGVPLAEADALAADVAALAGVPAHQLVAQPAVKRGNRTVQRYTRTWEGAEVLGDQVLLVAEGGAVGAVWAQLTPIGGAATPRPGEVVLPLARFDGAPWASTSSGVRARLVTPIEDGPLVRYRDRAGVEVSVRDTRHFAQVQVAHYARTVGDALELHPASGVTVTATDGATAITAADGSHGLTGDLTVALDGPDLWLARNRTLVEVAGTDDVALTGGDDVSHATAVVLHHTGVVFGWLEARWPTHAWLGQQVLADVDRDDSACNAWYTNGTVTFLQGYAGYCNNFGQIADVVYHEVGHGIHQYILTGGTFAGDISEGSADYISATIHNDPVLAPNALPGGGAIREIDTDRRYPEDRDGGVHNDGLIWASFLWNLRGQWQASRGEAVGARDTDLLFLGALEQGPTLTDAYEAVITADDDNGDLTDGTPHACELVALLDQHGLGPGPIGVVQIDHVPVGAQDSTAVNYPVSFTVAAPTAACGQLDTDSIRLWWTTDPTHAPGLESAAEPGASDTGSSGSGASDSGSSDSGSSDSGSTTPPDPYAAWQAADLTRDGWTWSGALPRVPATTTVSYFIEAASTGGEQVVRSHAGERALLHQFVVGDTEPLWCEDFEGGATDWTHGPGTPWQEPRDRWVDEWAVGAPVDGAFSAHTAPSGSAIAATAPGGPYRADNRQYLQSPEVFLDGPRPMLRFTYQRWLTVEDGLYDRAQVWGGAEGADLWWENAAGGGAANLLDTAWVTHAWPLDVPEGGAPYRFTWTLDSDPGLEFGGWHLDDVCVTALADPAAHYQRAALVASDDAAVVTITAEQPWIVPLAETVLVRRMDAWPTGPDDPEATVLAQTLAPTPGAPLQVEDPTLTEGETAYYALFASDGERWHLELIDGDNADVGGVPAPEVPDTGEEGDPGDGGESGVTPGDRPAAQPACGCSPGAAPTGLAALLALLPLVGRRRRG